MSFDKEKIYITSASGLICRTGFYFISFGHKNSVLFIFDETLKPYFFINMTRENIVKTRLHRWNHVSLQNFDSEFF